MLQCGLAVVVGLVSCLCHSGAWHSPPAAVTVGVDYYPEQWDAGEMASDMASIKHDLGADIIRVGEFMWHSIEPADGVFDFAQLDRIIDAAEAAGLSVMLGTPTAGMPAWLYNRYNVAMVGPDSADGLSGATAGFGGRREYSFNSPDYRRYARRVVTQLAMRYGPRKVVVGWQVDNEIAHEGSDIDFSAFSLIAWRQWLSEQYSDNITTLNQAWGSVFWGTTYNTFDEVPLPKWTIPGTPPRANEAWRSNFNPGALLDFRLFRADTVASFAAEHVEILRNSSTTAFITTNSPGGVWAKAIDSNTIFAAMDVAAYDNYPVWGTQASPSEPSLVGMQLDTVRGWGWFDNPAPPSVRGKSTRGTTGTTGAARGFTISEQLIGAQGHDIIGFTPRPNQIVAWSAQTLLHGATSLLFFRYRAAVFGQEQFCYGVLDHTTPRGAGRKWQEAKETFELARGPYMSLWLAPVVARVLLLYTPRNIFAWQSQPQSTAFDFETEAHRLYHSFWRQGIAIDVASSERLADEALEHRSGAAIGSAGDQRRDILLSNYEIILLPAPMMVADSLYSALEAFVDRGGALLVSFRADIKEYSNNQMRRQPSRLAALAGVVVEEIESLNSPQTIEIRSSSGGSSNDVVSAAVWRDGLRIVSPEDTVSLFDYTDADFFGGLGYHAVTRRRPASSAGGEVIYIGTGIDPEALGAVAFDTLSRRELLPFKFPSKSPNVEQMVRVDTSGQAFSVRINHGGAPASVTTNNGTAIRLRPYGIDIRPHEANIRGAGASSSGGDSKLAWAETVTFL